MPNGNLKTILAGAGVLLTIGASYASLHSKTDDNASRIAAVERTIEDKSATPAASAAGAVLQQEINEINRRLDRIEAKQDEMLRILTRPH